MNFWVAVAELYALIILFIVVLVILYGVGRD